VSAFHRHPHIGVPGKLFGLDQLRPVVEQNGIECCREGPARLRQSVLPSRHQRQDLLPILLTFDRGENMDPADADAQATESPSALAARASRTTDNPPDRKPFRVLSLDGGGMMGAFTASVLATCETECLARTGKRLIDCFDLITGTSTGGIIGIGLAMGSTAEQILDFYRVRGVRIFPPTAGVSNWLRTVHNLFRPKFSPRELRQAIGDVVGDRPLGDARTRLVIPAYDTEMGRVFLFKTPHHPNCTYARGVKAVDAALATSAAPTYFPAHHVPDHGTFIDGGVWGNCPAVIGIAEAVSYCSQKLEDIYVLSVSTTNYPFRIGERQQLRGLVGWGPKIIETFMFSQTQAAVGEATCLLRERTHSPPTDRFHRIDYVTEPHLFKLDGAKAAQKLIEIGRNVANQVAHAEVVKRSFLNGKPAEPFRTM
jgi:patatin-like phospholipase/acyl hydrolase